MDEQKVRKLIGAWHAKAVPERDDITRFVFLWFCFNARLAYESEEDFDRSMIDWLSSTDEKTSQLRRAFSWKMQSDAFCANVQELARLSPISGNGRRPRTYYVDSLYDFAGIVNCVYQVRCNLFHGSKSIDDARDEALVRVCATIMDEWIGCLVAMWQPGDLEERLLLT